MAAVCPIGFDVEGLKGEVRRTYASVATDRAANSTSTGDPDMRRAS
jgi:hypothetical protein